jgi:hypothetical protein
MNKDLNEDINDLEKPNPKTKTNVIKEEGKYKFRRSTVIYNFINFIVKRIYLINDYSDTE